MRYRAKSLSARVNGQTFEVTDFLARLLQHVPEPRFHQLRYYGHYSNVARARRAEEPPSAQLACEPALTEPGAAERRRLRRSWAQLIRRIYEVDPLVCTECGGEMHIIAFLLDPAVVRKILAHLARGPVAAELPRPLPARRLWNHASEALGSGPARHGRAVRSTAESGPAGAYRRRCAGPLAGIFEALTPN